MEAIGALTGGMAHDFNNLLAVVIGNLDILVDRKKDDPDVKELGGEALDAALRGADLTQRLLAFARRQTLQPRAINLNETIEDLRKLLSRTLGENIEISLDLDPDLWSTVADPAGLDACLTNLATNARDAMPKGGSLLIVTANRHLDTDYAATHAEVTPGDYAMIEVSDTGAGMTPDVAQRVFEPFFTTKQPGRGTGLGLSMVYGFIKQSGGHINLYSEPGIGTTFRLYLPRTAARTSAPTAKSTVTAPAAALGEMILTVEDNRSLRRVVVRQLTQMGYRVLEAENAAEALKTLETEKIDLLFSDVVMAGGMSGIDLARTALQRWPALKVLLTSGFPETKLNGNGHGPIPARLLNKPYRKEDLARAILAALGHS
jgi:CheY-like chemotaxis protein